jgi:hypothetical protein
LLESYPGETSLRALVVGYRVLWWNMAALKKNGTVTQRLSTEGTVADATYGLSSDSDLSWLWPLATLDFETCTHLSRSERGDKEGKEDSNARGLRSWLCAGPAAAGEHTVWLPNYSPVTAANQDGSETVGDKAALKRAMVGRGPLKNAFDASSLDRDDHGNSEEAKPRDEREWVGTKIEVCLPLSLVMS